MTTTPVTEQPVYRTITTGLLARKVETLFGVVGEDTIALVHDLELAGVHYVGARHESAAVAMADGYSWATGRLGVCTVTRGPGLTNALTACRTAVRRGQRLLILTGDNPAVTSGGGFYKDIDQGPVCRSVGLEYFAAAEPEEIAPALHAALEAAEAGRPAVLAVTADVLNRATGGTGEVSPEAPAPVAVEPSTDDVARLAELLGAAERPLILAGQGAFGARDELVRLSERTGALIGTTLLAKGLFRGESYDVGVIGGFASDPVAPLLPEADLLVAFGAAINPFTTAEWALFQDIPVVQVALERRADPAAPVTLSIAADAALTAERVLEAVTSPASPPGAEVLERLAAPVYSGGDESTADELDPRAVATALDELLPPDRVLVLDSGRFMNAPGKYVYVQDPPSIRHTAEGGSIGLGLGVALGAAAGRPERTTVLFTGDGGLSMALADLETAHRHGLPLIVVVMNDRAYGSELNVLASMGLPGEMAELPDMDFAAVAAAVGIEGHTVRTVAELRALAPALSGRSAPLLVDCKIRQDLVVPRNA